MAARESTDLYRTDRRCLSVLLRIERLLLGKKTCKHSKLAAEGFVCPLHIEYIVICSSRGETPASSFGLMLRCR